MNQHTFDNWKKIKIALEEANKTDCMFYKRACSIIETKRDPLEHVFRENRKEIQENKE
jgi:hypothetical protein